MGARDPATGGFVMLGKTFKGMTDEMLEWQTKELLARETRRDGHIVYVRPELVVEIAFNEVQRSSQYPGGVVMSGVESLYPFLYSGVADVQAVLAEVSRSTTEKTEEINRLRADVLELYRARLIECAGAMGLDMHQRWRPADHRR